MTPLEPIPQDLRNSNVAHQLNKALARSHIERLTRLIEIHSELAQRYKWRDEKLKEAIETSICNHFSAEREYWEMVLIDPEKGFWTEEEREAWVRARILDEVD